MPSIPRAIGMEQVRLAGQYQSTYCNRASDYAILLLLARLGLRSCEIAFLDLEDIDWKTAV